MVWIHQQTILHFCLITSHISYFVMKPFMMIKVQNNNTETLFILKTKCIKRVCPLSVLSLLILPPEPLLNTKLCRAFPPPISSFSSHFTPQHAFLWTRGICIPSFVRRAAALTRPILLQRFVLDTRTVADAGIAAYCSLYCCSHCESLWIKFARKTRLGGFKRDVQSLLNGYTEFGNKRRVLLNLRLHKSLYPACMDGCGDLF